MSSVRFRVLALATLRRSRSTPTAPAPVLDALVAGERLTLDFSDRGARRVAHDLRRRALVNQLTDASLREGPIALTVWQPRSRSATRGSDT